MGKDKRKLFIYLPMALALSIVIGIFLGSRFNVDSNHNTRFRKFNKVNEVLNYIFEEYVDSVDKSALIEGSLVSLLKDLDPHSSYISTKDLRSLSEPLEGNFEGIGIEFNIIKDTIIVISPISGGPSEALGLEAGDRIIKIEQERVAGTGVTNKAVMNMLRGPKGTSVDISIKRRGTTAMIDYTIIRGEIPIYSVDIAYMINDSIGYIKINRFSAKTHEEFVSAFKSLPKRRLNGLVLDLRGNPGGYLSAAIAVADEFLDRNQLIVYTQGKAHPKTPYEATSSGLFKEGKIIVLIDEGSASASEIVAGAIQDNDRGIILGRRSFGKGLVQEQFVFPDGSAVRLTIARYYTPTGRCIQRPYDEGLESYYRDVYKRLGNDESAENDSSYFNDSLKFITPAGKTVYGGGGIKPDIHVSVDTVGQSIYLRRIVNRGLINQFAFDYADKNRKKLNTYRKVSDYDEGFSLTERELQSFYSYAMDKGVEKDERDIAVSAQLIEFRIKAYIARHIWNNEGFYPVIHHIDKTLQKAVEEIQDENFSIITDKLP
ncbi:MAG TPA: S41 family peptidase [Flavobacteriales bacterium]|nr:S41 family peptidase [Flavobacteriales bacterium]